MRNLYAGQEAIVRAGHGTIDWFQIVPALTGTSRLYIVTLLFNFYAEYIMRNAGLDEAQAGIKTARRNMNNPRFADDTTLMAGSKEELKSLLMKEKKESENRLKLNIQKTKIMASSPITSWQIDGETVETVTAFILGGSKNTTADGDCSHEIKRRVHFGRKVMTNVGSTLKSRDIIANKGPSSQSYGFSSSHGWM